MTARLIFSDIHGFNYSKFTSRRTRRMGRAVGAVAVKAGRTGRVGGLEMLESRLLFSTITVTSLADDGSTGTLRDAVTQANASTDPVNTINFAPGLTGVISLTGGELELTGADTVIQGPGAASLSLSGAGGNPVLRVDGGATADVSGLTITQGAGVLGGGIDNTGTLTIEDSVLSNNAATGGEGGAIFSTGSLAVIDSTLSANSSSFGGAIYAGSGTVSISGSTFSNNSADTSGGALQTNFAAVNIVNSTFAGNSTAGQGGAIFNSSGALTLTNSTVADNTAATDGGGIHSEDGSGDLTLYNTIVAANTLSDATTPSDITGTVDQGLATSQAASANNLIGLGGSGGLTSGTAGNLIGVANPKLAALANNGGPTQTIALLPGSPAIDAGSNALALDLNGNPLTTDQRGAGFARVINRVVDIGAFEAPAPVVPATNTPVVSVSAVTATVGHHVSLTATLDDSNNKPISKQTITFSVDGVVVGSAKTNCNGVARLCDRLSLAPGVYTGGIVATFAATSKYAAATGSATLTVNDAPICAHDLDVSIKHSLATATAEFTQDRPAALASDFTATIDWGDGSGSMPATVSLVTCHCGQHFAVTATHTYVASKPTKTYLVTLTITSKYGATKTLTEHVRN